MTVSAERQERRQFARDHESSLMARMERGKMPGSIEGLVAWYIGAMAEEGPERLHKGELWHDSVSAGEREDGIRPQGGSLLGTPAWSGGMRALLENGASQTDEDGYYRFPVRAALSRMHRRTPLMSRVLVALAMREGDWRGLGVAHGWLPEMFEVYIAEALRRLWIGFHEQTIRRVA